MFDLKCVNFCELRRTKRVVLTKRLYQVLNKLELVANKFHQEVYLKWKTRLTKELKRL